MQGYGAIFLLAGLYFAGLSFANPVEGELSEFLRKKDWPGITLLLEPEKGQNFEHDLVLAKAYLALERRSDALAVLSPYFGIRKDEKTQKFFELAGTLFFSQDTAQLYFESVRLLSMSKFSEAKDKLDQGLAREPGHVLLLTRKVQVELLLGMMPQAAQHLKQAQKFAPFSSELKLLGAKLALGPTQSEQDWYKTFQPLKNLMQDREGPMLLWLEALSRSKKQMELIATAEKVIRYHPQWSGALVWIYKKEILKPGQQAKLKNQIEKNLKDAEAFSQTLDRELKLNQYLWAGMYTFDSLVNQMRGI